MREAGTVVTRERLIDEVWDVNWFGSTKTLDVHVARSARSSATTRRPRYLHTVRGVGFRFAGAGGGRVSLRLRLLAAFAYVLVLVLVALVVPLALNLSRRVDAEVKAEAAGQAQLVAASAAARLDSTRELAAARATAGRRARRPRHRRRPPRPRCSPTPPAAALRGASYGDAGRRSRARSRGETDAGHARTATRSTSELLYTAVPDRRATAARAGAVRIDPVRRRRSAPRCARDTLALDRPRRRPRSLLGLGRRLAPRGLPGAAAARPRRRRPPGRRAATWTRARASRPARASTARSRTRFNEMTERLGRALAAQREFVANASHQLRTPLTGPAPPAGGRAATRRPTPTLRRDLEAAERETERLDRLLTDLLTLAARRRALARGRARRARRRRPRRPASAGTTPPPQRGTPSS